tara:strand:- start:444 stop:833 length:390 start_codon:yes stop_codon:yes gene_type:complete
MLAKLAQQDLIELIGEDSGQCVSILMPTYESGPETAQNSIRFKNLVTQAIENTSDSCEKLQRRLQELSRLGQDDNFWQHHSAGLAIFVCEHGEQRFRLPQSPRETVYVGEEYCVEPVAAMVSVVAQAID